MAPEDLIHLLRDATEDDVDRVLPRLLEDGAIVIASHADLLKFFNRMLDELIGERASGEEADDINIAYLTARIRDASGEG
jgi:hypothetical protein